MHGLLLCLGQQHAAHSPASLLVQVATLAKQRLSRCWAMRCKCATPLVSLVTRGWLGSEMKRPSGCWWPKQSWRWSNSAGTEEGLLPRGTLRDVITGQDSTTLEG